MVSLHWSSSRAAGPTGRDILAQGRMDGGGRPGTIEDGGGRRE